MKKKNESKAEKATTNSFDNVIESLDRFIEKKELQNEALKKIAEIDKSAESNQYKKK